MSFRLFPLYCTHVFRILHFSENAFLLLHSHRGLRTVQRPDFYLCLSAVCTCVCWDRNARAANPSTCKHHIGILNGSWRGIRAGMPSRWTSKMRSHCFRFRTRVLISSPTCTAVYKFMVSCCYVIYCSIQCQSSR
jgi:hypothetical protein